MREKVQRKGINWTIKIITATHFDLGGKSGVYTIKNSVNGREYIGTTVTSFDSRWYSHRTKLRRGVHGNKELQRDWDIYGADNFTFTVLVYTDDPCPVEKEQIKQRRNSEIAPYNTMLG